MKLTPLEIRKQEFRKTLRGFDPVEVQTFLEMVAEQYEKLLEENKALNRKVIELQTRLEGYQETERNLRETLMNLQEVKRQSEESSRRQADLIIKEAELKAIEILENARKQARQIREEVNWLKSQKESFINRLRHILVSQIELLSVMEIDDAIPPEVQQFMKNARSKKLKGIREAQALQEPSGDRKESPILMDESTSSTGSTADDSSSKSESGEETESLPNVSEEEIDDLFKKGINIDELIKDLNKKKDKEK